MQPTMRLIAALLTAVLMAPVYAQHGPSQGGARDQRTVSQRPMPPPERRMGWEERQRLREQVRNGQMTRDEARARWHEQRAADPERFSREQREQLRRDVQEANRDMPRR
jgi:hypothetical protein